jgi:spore germination protein YaaH
MPLKRRVFGYHDSSTSTGTPPYRYDLLSTLGYFACSVDSTTGACTAPKDWPESEVIAEAHKSGVKVLLVAALFKAAENRELLSSPTRRANAVRALLEIARAGKADGVNIDFEAVPRDQRDNFTEFMKELAQGFKAIPGAEISAALPPAIGENSVFDLAGVAAVSDYLVLMGYDYAWQTAPNAGPVAPLTGGAFNVTNSVDAYLAKIPASKLVLAVPYFGYDWETVDTSPRAKVKTDADNKPIMAKARGYTDNVERAKKAGYRVDAATKSPYYVYDNGGQPHVAWFDDEKSLAAKYALVNERRLAGVGIWNLGWGDGAAPLWDALSRAFT